MKKVKVFLLGLFTLGFIMGINANVCYAATNSISCTVTSTKISGTYKYSKSGSQVKGTVYYLEKKNNSVELLYKNASDVQNGVVTTASVTRKNTSGYKITRGEAFGYVDGTVVASTGEIFAD